LSGAAGDNLIGCNSSLENSYCSCYVPERS
jgi:hypothetical protein